MKSLGIVRIFDDLGRVVIPIELRRGMNIITKGDRIAITLENGLVKINPNPMTGDKFVRSVDDLGRFVLPIEMRKTLEIGEGDGVSFFYDDDFIYLQPYHVSCVFCGEKHNLVKHMNKNVCHVCIKVLNDLTGGE